MKKLAWLLILIVGLLGVTTPVMAQTTVSSTTLSTALTDTNTTNQVVLASVGSGSTAVLAGNILFIDGEAMLVKTTPTTTTVSVARHTNSTAGQTHAANSIVYYGPPQAFVSGKIGAQFYQGSCTASANLYLPVIDIVNATIGNCVTSTWRWYRLNAASAMNFPHTAITAAYTAVHGDFIIGVTTLSAALTVTLPAATGLAGHVYIIANESTIASNTIWVTAGSNINGSSASIGVYGIPTGAPTNLTGVLKVLSNGTGWFSF